MNQTKKLFNFWVKKAKNEIQKTESEIKKRNIISEFTNNPYYVIPIRIFILLLGVTFILLALVIKKLPPLIPLYYSLPWGEEQLGKPIELIILPFSMIVFFLATFIFNLLVPKKDYFLIQVLLWSGIMLLLLQLFSIIKIVLIVI